MRVDEWLPCRLRMCGRKALCSRKRPMCDGCTSTSNLHCREPCDMMHCTSLLARSRNTAISNTLQQSMPWRSMPWQGAVLPRICGSDGPGDRAKPSVRLLIGTTNESEWSVTEAARHLTGQLTISPRSASRGICTNLSEPCAGYMCHSKSVSIPGETICSPYLALWSMIFLHLISQAWHIARGTSPTQRACCAQA